MYEEASMQFSCFHGWLFPVGSFRNRENSRDMEGVLCSINSETPPPTQMSHFNGVIYGYSSSAVVCFGLLIIKGIRVLGRQKREKSYLDFLRSLRSGRNSMGMVELPIDNCPAY